MSNFDPNAIIRGAQLTIVGAVRALQNPGLFKYEHYKQAAIAVAAGLAIRLIVAAPIIAIKSILRFIALFYSLDTVSWDDKLLARLDFIGTYVLQAPFFLMTLMRYITPTLDDLFMDSLRWVDYTYALKHSSDDPATLRAMYYPNLRLYSAHGGAARSRRDPTGAFLAFLKRYARRAGISLLVYALSFLPFVGRFVLPAASFYTLNKAVGPGPAAAVFAAGLVLPKRYLVVFLQTYFASRSLMRELLEPYFSRLPFTPAQRRRWFHDRDALLFGFGLGFYILLRIPLLGVLIYGVAEASTAYLITKITDPPPPPAYVSVPGPVSESTAKDVKDVKGTKDAKEDFLESQTRWRNKVEFLTLPLDALDVRNVARFERELRGRIGKGDGGGAADEGASTEGDGRLEREN